MCALHNEDNAGTMTIQAPCPSRIPFSSLSGSRSDWWGGVLRWGWLWPGWGWYPQAHSLQMDEDSYHDVQWMAWTIQYISQVLRFFFDILAGPQPLFPQNILVCSILVCMEFVQPHMMNTRIERETFDYLVSKLAWNPLYYSPHKPQQPIKYQLAAFLIWYGQCASDTLDIAAKLFIGHGSVHNYCRRVCQVLWELQPEYLAWMTDLCKEDWWSWWDENPLVKWV